MTENPGYSVDFRLGFKFRGLNDPTMFLDDNHKRMIQNYRNSFLRLTLYKINSGQNQEAIKVLNSMEEKIPRNNVGMDYGLLYEIGNLYLRAGGKEEYNKIAKDVEEQALEKLAADPNDTQSYYNPYRVLIEMYESQGNYLGLIHVWEQLEKLFPNDPNVKTSLEKHKELVEGRDTSKVN